MDVMIMGGTGDATAMFDENWQQIPTQPLGPRAEVVAALREAVPTIQFDDADGTSGYIPDGISVTVTGDPVTGISLDDVDADVLEQLTPLLRRSGWAAFEGGDGQRALTRGSQTTWAYSPLE